MFAKISATNEVILYPYTMTNWRQENPYTRPWTGDMAAAYEGTDAALADNSTVVPVVYTQQPRPAWNQRVVEGGIARGEDGVWRVVWNLELLTGSALADATTQKELEVRGDRDRLLEKTDWTQLSDNALSTSQRAAFVPYRQGLRDITTHRNFPDLQPDDWPVSPPTTPEVPATPPSSGGTGGGSGGGTGGGTTPPADPPPSE